MGAPLSVMSVRRAPGARQACVRTRQAPGQRAESQSVVGRGLVRGGVFRTFGGCTRDFAGGLRGPRGSVFRGLARRVFRSSTEGSRG